MKHTLILFFILLSTQYYAQSYTTTCTASDSITKLWGIQADRLALRYEYAKGDTYKDSLRINPSLRQRYLNALLAVYNCTAAPTRDTIFSALKIVTNPNPEMNNILVQAPSSLGWMLQLFNNQSPVSSPPIFNLMNRYNMQFTYIQSAPNDAILFHTDTCLNLPILVPIFLSQAAISAAPTNGYDDVRNITDSVNANFIILNYSFGWGTCENGCDYRRTWTYKVYNNCTVEFLGLSSVFLYLGISDQTLSSRPILVNPSRNNIQLLNLNSPGILRLYRMDGILIATQSVSSANDEIQWPSELSTGFYLLKLETESGEFTYKALFERE